MTGLTIVQARLGSTRFPRKILADLAGKPVLTWVVERAMQIGLTTVVACPGLDVAAISPVVPAGALVYGSHKRQEQDVLGRFADVIKACAPLDYVVRITGDSPFLDPAIGRDLVKCFVASRGRAPARDRPGYDLVWGFDYMANCYPPPDCLDGGLDIEILAAHSMVQADFEADDPLDREHPTRYLWRHPDLFQCENLPIPDRYGDGTLGIRWMVDTPEDLTRLTRIAEALATTPSSEPEDWRRTRLAEAKAEGVRA